MRKVLSAVALLLAVVMLAASFAACGGDNKSDESAEEETTAPVLAGTYKMLDLEGEGESFEQNKKTFDQLKDYYVLEIKDDNSAELKFEYKTIAETAHITFDPDTQTAVFAENDSKATYTFDGKTLKIKMTNDITQIYEKQS